jgi:hypothetical protein
LQLRQPDGSRRRSGWRHRKDLSADTAWNHRSKNGSLDVLTDIGPILKGVTPPLTPTGLAALGRSRIGNASIDIPAVAGHIGLLFRWRVNENTVKELLPPPISPVADSDCIYLFLNRTQTGLNLFQANGAEEQMLELSPHHVNWHEALFWIPCEYNGVRAHYTWCIYKDIDHGVLLGLHNGFNTKLADFSESFTTGGARQSQEPQAGQVLRLKMMRQGERILDATFVTESEMPRAEIDETIRLGDISNSLAIRYFPDVTRPDAKPLVHDLVLRQMRAMDISRAWRGHGTITLSASDYDELNLFEPVEMLGSYFCYLEYTSSPAMCRIIHDYRQQPIP